MTTEQAGPATFTEGEWSSMAQKLHTFAGALSSGEQAAFAAHLQELFAQVAALTLSAADTSGFGGTVYAAAKPWDRPIRSEDWLDLPGHPRFPRGWPYW